MNLTYDDFRKGDKLYSGKLADRFYFNGGEIFKLPDNKYFIRTDWHTLPLVGFYPLVEIFKIQNKMVMVFLDNHYYTFIETVNVFEGKTLKQFDGFKPGKEFELTNGQIWQQIDGPYAQNHISTGYVRIINEEIMMVDNWSFYPNVRRIK
jgi:hypothetical protein